PANCDTPLRCTTLTHPPTSTPFPYTTLFRSPIDRKVALLQQSVDIHREQQQKGLILPVDVEVVTKQLNGAQSLSKIDRKDQSLLDRKSTRLNSSHLGISYAVFCLKKKKNIDR